MRYPCKGCLERHAACWDSCARYQEVKAQYDAHKKKIRGSVAAEAHTIKMIRKVDDTNAKRKKNGRLTWR